tara:strand:+ start:192 stop:539 length:348 start_codon:yes stop_codon:yes gene_type:complete
MKFLKNPLYNSIFSGILIYILIVISNKGNPVLGAILSSLPIGLMGLIAIKQKNNIQNFYIRSEIFTNLIIIIMWIVINILLTYKKKTRTIVLIGLMTWIILSIIFYLVFKRLIPN